MQTQTCSARTSVKNAARGRPCKMTRISASGRCKFHGGHSTGPRTQEGRDRIAAAQRKRWAEWRAANPKLFVDLSDRQEQRVKKAFKIERQNQSLRSETEAWLIDRYGPDWQSGMRRALEEMQRRRAEEGRRREALKPLTPEQNAVADQFLAQWQAKATRSETKEWVQRLLDETGRGYIVRDTPTADWITKHIEETKPAATTQPVNTGQKQVPQPDNTGRGTGGVPADNTAQKLQGPIARQPISRIRRMEYAERVEATQAHGQALIDRYGIDPVRRPTVTVGHSAKKRR